MYDQSDNLRPSSAQRMLSKKYTHCAQTPTRGDSNFYPRRQLVRRPTRHAPHPPRRTHPMRAVRHPAEWPGPKAQAIPWSAGGRRPKTVQQILLKSSYEVLAGDALGGEKCLEVARRQEESSVTAPEFYVGRSRRTALFIGYAADGLSGRGHRR